MFDKVTLINGKNPTSFSTLLTIILLELYNTCTPVQYIVLPLLHPCSIRQKSKPVKFHYDKIINYLYLKTRTLFSLLI